MAEWPHESSVPAVGEIEAEAVVPLDSIPKSGRICKLDT